MKTKRIKSVSSGVGLLSEKSQQLIDYWQIRALTAEGKFEKLQKAILEYCNLYEIHPYQAGWDNVWPYAEIKVNKRRDAWILEER